MMMIKFTEKSKKLRTFLTQTELCGIAISRSPLIFRRHSVHSPHLCGSESASGLVRRPQPTYQLRYVSPRWDACCQCRIRFRAVAP